MVTGMAEEVVQPERSLPRALTWTVPISLVLEWLFYLPLTFTLPDPDKLLSARKSLLRSSKRHLLIVCSEWQRLAVHDQADHRQ